MSCLNVDSFKGYLYNVNALIIFVVALGGNHYFVKQTNVQECSEIIQDFYMVVRDNKFVFSRIYLSQTILFPLATLS